MHQYTVVISDVGKHDHGYRGSRTYWTLASHFGAYAELGLYWFLGAYFGRPAVALVRPSELLARSSAFKTDTLFVGLPTSLRGEHLQNVRFRRLVLYDSTDFDGVNFGDSDKAWLLEQTDTCLKNWRDDRWQLELKIGLLPIKRPPLNNRLRTAIKIAAAKRTLGMAPQKTFDVGFVARPTGSVSSNQRLQWLYELKSVRPQWKLWGGLVGADSWRQTLGAEHHAEVLQTCWLNRRKVSFFRYFNGLCQSKVALAPRGYAPWTYRHFEALYAGCSVVSNDLSHYEFLVPFPREKMIEVGDDDSVVPAIEAALKMLERAPETAAANRDYLDGWLDDGVYSRRLPQTLARFMAALQGEPLT